MTEVKDQPLNIGVAMELLRKAGGGWDPSDSGPMGPTEDCFSAEHLVYLSRRGATKRDIYHLLQCKSCQNWVSNFVQVKAKMPISARAEQQASTWSALLALFRPSPPVAIQPNTVLYIPSQLEVSNLTKPNLSVELGIVSSPSGSFDAIDVASLRLCGALTGDNATLSATETDGVRYWVRFKGVDLGQSAKRDLARHREASHTVYLSGRLKNLKDQELKGQAEVNFLTA